MSVRQGTRIAFMGAGGTGKTTSAVFLAEALDLPQPKSASRMVYEDRCLTEAMVLDMDAEDQLILQTYIFEQKVLNDQEYSYVTDRTILDHYAYCLAYCGAHMGSDTFREYEEKTRQAMLSTYSHIFYFPWGYWHAADDGVRSASEAWQSQIDALMVGYIMRWDLPVIEVPQTLGEAYRNAFLISTIEGKE